MAHRVAPISVYIALGLTSANAVKVTVEFTSTGSSGCFTFLLNSICRAPDEKAKNTILNVFGMTRPGLEPTTYRL